VPEIEDVEETHAAALAFRYLRIAMSAYGATQTRELRNVRIEEPRRAGHWRSRGIGKAIALTLAKAGAAVAVNYRERSGEAASVVDAVQLSGGRAVAIAADVSIAGAVQSMVREVEAQLGPIGILVNNAGMAAMRGLDDITEEPSPSI
jgi:hypothetical protein